MKNIVLNNIGSSEPNNNDIRSITVQKQLRPTCTPPEFESADSPQSISADEWSTTTIPFHRRQL